MSTVLASLDGERTYGVLHVSHHLSPTPTNAPRCLLLYRLEVPLARRHYRSFTHEFLEIRDALSAPIAGEA